MTMLAIVKGGISFLFMSAPLGNLVVGISSAAMWGAHHFMAKARSLVVTQFWLHVQSLCWTRVEVYYIRTGEVP